MDPDSKNFSRDLSKTFFRSKKVQIAASNELSKLRGKMRKNAAKMSKTIKPNWRTRSSVFEISNIHQFFSYDCLVPKIAACSVFFNLGFNAAEGGEKK